MKHYVQRAAEMLRKSERPVLVLGAACVQDAKLVPAVAAAARALGLPVWLFFFFFFVCLVQLIPFNSNTNEGMSEMVSPLLN